MTRHALWTHEKIDPRSPKYAKMLARVKQWAAENQIEITLSTTNGQVIRGGNFKNPEFHLLEIRRE